jgi:hypothetical protein
MAGEPARVGHIPDGAVKVQQVDQADQPTLALEDGQ